jgi:hypothetical protein
MWNRTVTWEENVEHHMPLEKICNISSTIGMEVALSRHQNLATWKKRYTSIKFIAQMHRCCMHEKHVSV